MRHLGEFSQRSAAAGRENVRTLGAIGTHKSAHVLHDAQHLDARFVAKRQLLAHVLQRNLLRRRHDDGAVTRDALHALHDGDVFVRCACKRNLGESKP